MKKTETSEQIAKKLLKQVLKKIEADDDPNIAMRYGEALGLLLVSFSLAYFSEKIFLDVIRKMLLIFNTEKEKQRKEQMYRKVE